MAHDEEGRGRSYRTLLRKQRWRSDDDREAWKHYLADLVELQRLQVWLLMVIGAILLVGFVGATVYLMLKY